MPTNDLWMAESRSRRIDTSSGRGWQRRSLCEKDPRRPPTSCARILTRYRPPRKRSAAHAESGRGHRQRSMNCRPALRRFRSNCLRPREHKAVRRNRGTKCLAPADGEEAGVLGDFPVRPSPGGCWQKAFGGASRQTRLCARIEKLPDARCRFTDVHDANGQNYRCSVCGGRTAQRMYASQQS